MQPAADRRRAAGGASSRRSPTSPSSAPSSPAPSPSTPRPDPRRRGRGDAERRPVSATGPQNPGLQGFLATELPWFAQRQVRTVVSLSGTSLAEYGELARRIGTGPASTAVEVHLTVADAYQTGKAVHVVRRDLPRGLPVHAKLGPAATWWTSPGRRDNGADAVVVSQGFPGLAIDPVTLRPALGAGGGLPAARRACARAGCVWDVHAALPEPRLVGVGGIRTGPTSWRCCSRAPPPSSSGSVLFRDPSAGHPDHRRARGRARPS